MLRRFGSGSYACALILALALASSSHAQPLVRQGVEFQVNVFTTGTQFSPGVALDPTGDFVVVWVSNGQDGASFGVFGRRYESTGVPQGTEFQISTYTAGAEFSPEVALRADGDFVLTWANSTEGAGLSGVVSRLFDSSGVAQGGEFHVNTFTVGYQSFPDIAASGDAGFVVVWTSGGQDGSYTGVFGRMLDQDGVAQGAEFQVNTYTSGYQSAGYVAAGALGDFVVVWSSSDGNGPGVFGRRFDSTGAALTDEFQVNTYTTGYQVLTRVASNGPGDFVVVWQSPHDGGSYGIFARRFDSAGTALASEFQVNTHTTNVQTSPDVDFDDDFGFTVTWSSSAQDGAQGGIFAKRYDPLGNVLAFEFQVNTRTADNQGDSRIAAQQSGQFVIAWVSNAHDGSQNGIFAQRLRPPVELDIDADGKARPLSDGMLVLRRGFEMTGPALINGVLGPSCVMCTAEHIEAYLDEISLALDVDANNLFEGEFDGVLVIRYLFGFRGDVLVEDAVAGDCNRCEAPDIEEYLEDQVTP